MRMANTNSNQDGPPPTNILVLRQKVIQMIQQGFFDSQLSSWAGTSTDGSRGFVPGTVSQNSHAFSAPVNGVNR